MAITVMQQAAHKEKSKVVQPLPGWLMITIIVIIVLTGIMAILALGFGVLTIDTIKKWIENQASK